MWLEQGAKIQAFSGIVGRQPKKSHFTVFGWATIRREREKTTRARIRRGRFGFRF